ncbi:Phosphoglycolate phosphatase [Rhodospirillaceae bacterium LM-1]|nr:Phosphoglycolate phosphatase [Rhodospirillaceae bacterium LM-1]
MDNRLNLRLVVFDVDGTLIDSQHNIAAAVADAWRAEGLTPPGAEKVRRNIGLPLEEAIAALIPEAEREFHLHLTDLYKQAFAANRQRADYVEPLYPGVLEALDWLEANDYLLGIATGKSRRGLDAVFERHHLRHRFVTVQTADDAPGKPNPGMLLNAMQETGAEALRTSMVGDTWFDMQMAANAGTRAIGVDWGYHDVSELKQAGALRILSAFAELPGAVADL